MTSFLEQHSETVTVRVLVCFSAAVTEQIRHEWLTDCSNAVTSMLHTSRYWQRHGLALQLVVKICSATGEELRRFRREHGTNRHHLLAPYAIAVSAPQAQQRLAHQLYALTWRVVAGKCLCDGVELGEVLFST